MGVLKDTGGTTYVCYNREEEFFGLLIAALPFVKSILKKINQFRTFRHIKDYDAVMQVDAPAGTDWEEADLLRVTFIHKKDEASQIFYDELGPPLCKTVTLRLE